MRTFVERFRPSARGAIQVLLASSALALAALVLEAPFLTPPLGATAYVCVRNPRAKTASPRNVILSHTIAVFCGILARKICMVPDLVRDGSGFPPSALMAGVLALGLTSFFTDMLNSAHAPAGASTLVVALGFLTGLKAQFALVAAAALLATLLTAYDKTARKRRVVVGSQSSADGGPLRS